MCERGDHQQPPPVGRRVVLRPHDRPPFAAVPDLDHRQAVALVLEHPHDDRPVPVDERVGDQFRDQEPPVVVVGDPPLGEPPGEKPPRLRRRLLGGVEHDRRIALAGGFHREYGHRRSPTRSARFARQMAKRHSALTDSGGGTVKTMASNILTSLSIDP